MEGSNRLDIGVSVANLGTVIPRRNDMVRKGCLLIRMIGIKSDARQ